MIVVMEIQIRRTLLPRNPKAIPCIKCMNNYKNIKTNQNKKRYFRLTYIVLINNELDYRKFELQAALKYETITKDLLINKFAGNVGLH